MSRHARNRIIYLHGYEPKGQGYFMPELELLVRHHVAGAGDPGLVIHWSPLRDTRNHTFVEVAQQLAEEIRDDGAYEKQYAVCHSMGGVIARQLAVMGIRLDGIVTLCTPHDGLGGWMTLPIQLGGEWFAGRGALSLIGGSRELQYLNASDAHLRNRYHFVGVQCIGPSGPNVWGGLNDNDTVVERASQHGTSLGGGIHRYTLCVDYGGEGVPQGLVGDNRCPHNYVVEHAMHTTSGKVGFDNTPLIAAIKNAIRL